MPRIEVTHEHIQRGQPGSATADALALAARAAGFPGAVVTPTGIKVGHLVHDLPDDACRFVADFDAGRPVEPFAFDLPPLDGPGWRAIGARRDERSEYLARREAHRLEAAGEERP